jgi:hypothetical protein
MKKMDVREENNDIYNEHLKKTSTKTLKNTNKNTEKKTPKHNNKIQKNNNIFNIVVHYCKQL